MELHQTKVADVTIVRPADKRIDAATATGFKQAMSDLIDAGARRIVLNLSDVDFIDSSGLGAIISSLKRLGNDGELVICSVRATVMSLFRLTRMDRVFDILSSEDEAVRSLSGQL